MRPETVVAVVIAIATIVVLTTTPTRESIFGIGAGIKTGIKTGLSEIFSDFVKTSGIAAKQADTLKTAFKNAELAGDLPKMQQLLNDAKNASTTGNAESVKHLSRLQNSIDEIGGGTVQAAGEAAAKASKLARVKELLSAARNSKATTKQLESRGRAILNTMPAFKALDELAKGSSATAAQKRTWQEALRTLDISQLSIMYGFVKNPELKEITKRAFATKALDVDIVRSANAVRQTPANFLQGATRAGNTLAESADNMPTNAADIARLDATRDVIETPSVLQSLKKYEKWGLIMGGLGIVSTVVATVVSLLVKPPYWNDPGVLAGTDGATPGQQPWVDFVNWVNENPAAVTMSSCMSCICCCCCCLLIVAMMGGGRKANNNFTM